MIDPNSERSIRQQECITKWINSKCRGSLILPTGFGKTYTAIQCIKRFLNKNPTKTILVVVPTLILKKQWYKNLDLEGLSLNCEVKVINTAIKEKQYYDFLIIDEIHRIASDTFSKIFINISYSMILGLTATYERLDGKEKLLDFYCPPCDHVTILEAVSKGWLSSSLIYKVIIEVDDIGIYENYNSQFIGHFSYFNFDWNLAMGCVTDYNKRVKYVKLITNNDKSLFNTTLKECTMHAFAWNKAMQMRKNFVNNHTKKLEIANKILDSRPLSKAIVFHSNIQQCENFNRGLIVHSQKKKKENLETLEKFNKLSHGSVINASKMLTEGLDVKGLNLAIILYNSSSSTERIQKYGRVLRVEPGKCAEIFSIIIKGTVEEQWFKKSAKDTEFIEINEQELELVLNNNFIKKSKIQTKEKYLMTF